MKNELYHYGILGQKWGVQNGPPYPLSKSSMSSSEKKHYNVSAKETKKNMDQMTDDELRKAINRIQMQNTVISLAKSDGIIKRGRNKVTSDLKAFGDFSNTAVSAYGAGKKIAALLGYL